MIDAVIVDMVGVLLRDEFPEREAFECRAGLAPGVLAEKAFYHPIAPLLLTGKKLPTDLWSAIREDLNLTEEDVRRLDDDFCGVPKWNHELLELLEPLKGRHKLGVLSNTWPGTREVVRERINSDLFDVIVFSYEEGIAKPDPHIYQRILSRMDLRADRTMFVDDRSENVEAAEALGIHGILFSEETEFTQRIAAFD